MNKDNEYDADYYLRGKETGKSLYENYRWMPELTIPMVVRMISHCNINVNHSILDFGCARGYIVRAFRELGYDAWGYDISKWAIENADTIAKNHIIVNDSALFADSFDWVIAKDVLEHVPQVANTIEELMSVARVGILAIVPLSPSDGANYVVQDYEKDVTHIHRLTLASWLRMFIQPDWSVTATYCLNGIKDNYKKYKTGNGFIIAKRMK